MVAVVAVSIVLNMSLIAYDSIKKGIHNFKIYMMIRKLKKQMKDRKCSIKKVVNKMKDVRAAIRYDLEQGELTEV